MPVAHAAGFNDLGDSHLTGNPLASADKAKTPVQEAEQMTQSPPASAETLRDRILQNPSAVLEDSEVMAHLIAADDAERGANVFDLRGLALSRLEARFDQLEKTHQEVLAAAYHNVATTDQVHRAIRALTGPLELEPFLQCLQSDVADILRLSSVRILLEPAEFRPVPLPNPSGVLLMVDPGMVELHVNTWRSGRSPDVVARRVAKDVLGVHANAASEVASEALVRLELGSHFRAGLLVLGSSDPDQYSASQSTDLLELFGRVFERLFRALLP